MYLSKDVPVTSLCVESGVGVICRRLDEGDPTLVRLVKSLLLELVTAGERGTLLSMGPCREVVVMSGVDDSDAVGDGDGKEILVELVFITPAGGTHV